MRDSYGRTIDYARISITDRCNLRCVYCMPAAGVPKRAHADILSYDAIERVCRLLSELGVKALKITGGEPLVRKNAAGLIARLKRLSGIDRVTLTTNGILLPDSVPALREAGLDGVNISLDTLAPELYRRMTRGGELAQALRGVDSALEAGFASVKINCVPLAEAAGQDLIELAKLARDRPLHVRFIELMPIGMGGGFHPVGNAQVRARLERALGTLVPCPSPLGSGPANYFAADGFRGAIGFVDALDHSQCGRCNRVRLTADGMLKTCLHMDSGISLKPALQQPGDGFLLDAIRNAIDNKPARHAFAAPAGGAEKRAMSEIGG